jgi:galactonate dehydratase
MAQEHDKVVRLQAHVAEVTPKTRWIFVQVTTASGLIGAGEGSLNNQEAAVLQALRGRSASLFALPHAVPTAWPKPQGLVEAAAVSALDQALWDITAQRSGQSMAAALGGVRRSSIPLYANINRRTLDRNPAGFAASARDALAAGFEAVKTRPGTGARRTRPRSGKDCRDAGSNRPDARPHGRLSLATGRAGGGNGHM